MPAIAVERTIGSTKRAVLGGLIGYNNEKMGRQKYKRLAVSLRERKKIVGGIVGEVWTTVLLSSFSGWIRSSAERISARNSSGRSRTRRENSGPRGLIWTP